MLVVSIHKDLTDIIIWPSRLFWGGGGSQIILLRCSSDLRLTTRVYHEDAFIPHL